MNNKTTQILSLLLVGLLCVVLLVGCKSPINSTQKPEDSDPSLTPNPDSPTTEPEYNWAQATVYNGGFETALDKYWLGTRIATISNTTCHTGSGSLQIGADSSFSGVVSQKVRSVLPGYYYLELYCNHLGELNCLYAYSNGTKQGPCKTALPRSISNNWTRVVVRGICVESDGLVEIGIVAGGDNGYAFVDDIRLVREENQTEQYPNLFGGAISWLDWEEDCGAKYYRSDGSEADALQIMAENGCNFVRLELYNNPGDYIYNADWDGKQYTFPTGYKDAEAIFRLAQRAHSKGMEIQLSFMYADYWGNDAIPSDWLQAIDGRAEEEIPDILAQCLYNYTKEFLQRLSNVGIHPKYVSLGNEMNGGILCPYGSTCGTSAQLEAFCKFMDAGYRAVKEVSPSSQVVLHIACNGDDMFYNNHNGMGKWFFNLCKNNNVAYDVIGTSFYPFWAQSNNPDADKTKLSTQDFIDWCNMMVKEFDKDVLVMETGINWGTPGQLSNNGYYDEIYPYTPQGQRDYMAEFINAIKCVDNGRCIGALYWDPVLVHQSGVGWAIDVSTGQGAQNVVETTTFFDYEHKALPIFDVYKFNCQESQSVLYGTVKQGEIALSNAQITLVLGDNSYIVTTDRYGQFFVQVSVYKGTLSVNGTNVCNVDLQYGLQLLLDVVL